MHILSQCERHEKNQCCCQSVLVLSVKFFDTHASEREASIEDQFRASGGRRSADRAFLEAAVPEVPERLVQIAAGNGELRQRLTE